MLFSVAALGKDLLVEYADYYSDSTIMAALRDGQGNRTRVCFDSLQGNPTRHRLF